MKKTIAVWVLSGVLGLSIILNLLQFARIDKLAKDVIELHQQQLYIESYINQLHSLDEEVPHGQ